MTEFHVASFVSAPACRFTQPEPICPFSFLPRDFLFARLRAQLKRYLPLFVGGIFHSSRSRLKFIESQRILRSVAKFRIKSRFFYSIYCNLTHFFSLVNLPNDLLYQSTRAKKLV